MSSRFCAQTLRPVVDIVLAAAMTNLTLCLPHRTVLYSATDCTYCTVPCPFEFKFNFNRFANLVAVQQGCRILSYHLDLMRTCFATQADASDGSRLGCVALFVCRNS
jgi:hypothetical protein